MLFKSPIDHQPDFPIEDLTEKNAQMLGLVRRNKQTLVEGHQAAETASVIYELGHRAFRSAFNRLFDNKSTIRAFDNGITTYEAISSLVTHPPSAEEQAPVILNAFGIARQVSARYFDEYIEEATQALIYAAPRTAEVVADVATDHSSVHLARFAVFGAGMARKFELDNMDIVH